MHNSIQKPLFGIEKDIKLYKVKFKFSFKMHIKNMKKK